MCQRVCYNPSSSASFSDILGATSTFFLGVSTLGCVVLGVEGLDEAGLDEAGLVAAGEDAGGLVTGAAGVQG